MLRTVCGVGLNDADYVVKPLVNGVRVPCPYYTRWRCMIERCYSIQVHKRQPTYSDCIVCEEWLTFSNFKAWMETQDWEGNQLDKDLLVEGNKVYGPDTCVFVSSDVNNFIIHDLKSGATRSGNKYQARFYSFDTRVSLGYFNTKECAEVAVVVARNAYVDMLINSQKNAKIADALFRRYKNGKA